jgi:hypothetical protein
MQFSSALLLQSISYTSQSSAQREIASCAQVRMT